MITVSPFGDELNGEWGLLFYFDSSAAADSIIIHYSFFIIHF